MANKHFRYFTEYIFVVHRIRSTTTRLFPLSVPVNPLKSVPRIMFLFSILRFVLNTRELDTNNQNIIAVFIRGIHTSIVAFVSF